MKELISKISFNTTTPWPVNILKQIRQEAEGGFSEFETYGTYISHFYPDLYTDRVLRTWRNAGYVFGRNISDKDIDSLAIDMDIISLECWSGRLFPRNVISRIQELYVKYQRYRYLQKEKMGSSVKVLAAVRSAFTCAEKVLKV